MVRLWARSPGIRSMHVGYQYNWREHSIEFVVKQDLRRPEGEFPEEPAISFQGPVTIRLMEAE